MNVKKTIITTVAFLTILAALYGVWEWQKRATNQPVRQEREIRR